MGLVYFDSSALVKLIVVEKGSRSASALWDDAEEAVSSELAYVEVRAALAAARRDDRLDAGDFRGAKHRWDKLWDATSAVAPTTELIGRAGELAERYGLRGYDAVHLASALTLATDSVVVASWDNRMRSGAEAAGLAVASAAAD